MFRFVIVMLVLVLAACGGDEDGVVSADASTSTTTSTAPADGTTSAAPPTTVAPEAAPTGADGCAHVIDVSIERGDSGFNFSATVLSGDTGWDKYADAWQVWGPDGEVLGERVLTHPHETEQPFTRSLSGVGIPADVAAVTVAARDLVLGFCGDVFTMEVPRS